MLGIFIVLLAVIVVGGIVVAWAFLTNDWSK